MKSVLHLFKDDSYSRAKDARKKKTPKQHGKPQTFEKQALGGLTSEQAARLLKQDGENKLQGGKSVSAVRIFAGQFKDFLVLILLVSTAISVFMGEMAEAISIAVIVLLNAILGFAQEFRTEKTLEALKSMTAPTAKVMRDGKLCRKPATELVRGDEILVEAGDRVPADAALIDCVRLEADESILTGESVPAAKEVDPSDDGSNELNKQNLIYMGTSIVKGHGRARVSATGMRTQMGHIAGMLEDIEEQPTPLQKRLDELGKYIIVGCLIVSVLVIITGLLRGEQLLQMLITGVSLAVAAVPEGLPAIVTIALALAVKRMVRRKALVRRLHAVETLGCANVVCTDKTGTLTENRMTVHEIVTAQETYDVDGRGYQRAGGFTLEGRRVKPQQQPVLMRLLETCVICNNASIQSDLPQNLRDRSRNRSEGSWNVMGEPTEIALLIAAAKGGVMASDLQTSYQVMDEIPFDSTSKYMTVFAQNPSGRKFAFVKGAYDVISKKCSRCQLDGQTKPFSEYRSRFDRENERLAAGGMRVLAIAFREMQDDVSEENLVFLGLCGMLDPPRKQAKSAVMTCRYAGIRTVMITGDHPLTAVAIAKQVGIYRKGDQCLTGAELDAMSDSALDQVVGKVTVFARVSPGHKLRIVRSFRRKGQVVAMTGDGVNDAPAVKEADIGVSMGESGSDVTKQAADVILLDDNFATLVAAVEEGRVIYSNIRKFIRYLLSCNIGEVITMFLGMLMGMPVPLLPMQILMVNLVTDGLPAIALGLDPAEPGTMRRPPRSVEEGVFSGGLTFTIILRGILIGLTTLTVFTLVFRMSLCVETARTAAFLALISTQLIHVFECKSETLSLFRIPYLNNKMLLLAVLFSGALAAVSIWVPVFNLLLRTRPLTAAQTMVTLACSLVVPVLNAVFLRLRQTSTKKQQVTLPADGT